MNRSVGSRIFLSKYREGVALKEEYLPRCHTIDGKIVGVIGSGNIGGQVAHLMQAFGATVQYYDAFRLSSQAEEAEGLSLQGSAGIVLHLRYYYPSRPPPARDRAYDQPGSTGFDGALRHHCQRRQRRRNL